jgi:hypothetical protein
VCVFEPSQVRNLFFSLAISLAPVLAYGEAKVAKAEIFEFGDFTLQVPAGDSGVRGVLLVLGGPDTRAFITDGSFGAPNPELEVALHQLRQQLQTLAATHVLAILGTSRHGLGSLPDQPESDVLISEAIDQAASISDHPELTRAPIFVYGISGGTPQATGFTARNPGRVGALLLKVPAVPLRLSHVEALAVPSYLILAEYEKLTDNTAVIEIFRSNRRAGGLWALAVEPGVPHHVLTPGARALKVNWLQAILELRLGGTPQTLRDIPESTGWLGDPVSGVASWADYSGDRSVASWFPSQAAAEEWWEFVSQ